MAHTIKITDLLDKDQFTQHQEVLIHYFENGGTWQDLLHYDENVLQTQYQKAYDLYHKADYKNAAAAFSYLTVLNPYNYNFWMGLGIAKQSDRLYEEAIVSYTAAEAMDPQHPLPHLHLAQCFYALHVRDEAVKHLQQAVTLSAERTEYQEVRLKASTILQHLPK
jgi:type III secretion system low calcium response chaperone LcrH/SycD